MLSKEGARSCNSQVGVGVSGGAEAAVHATRRLMSSLPDNHVFVKLDFSNAFNSIRRDTILAKVAVKMPELYRFVKDSLNCNPMLIYGDDIIISAESSQQGDPLSGLEFCESSSQPYSRRKFEPQWALPETFRPSSTTRLVLNARKCEITTKNCEMIDKFSIFKDFKRVAADDLTILDAPVLEGRAVDNALKDKIATLERSIKRLSTLQSHDALCL